LVAGDNGSRARSANISDEKGKARKSRRGALIMIKIIAIEREFGCNASAIAETLGTRLAWKVLDQSLTEEVARIAQVARGVVEQREECMDPFFYRLLKVFRCGSQERAIPVSGQEVFDADRMVKLVQKLVEDAAVAGSCIIVGRGSAFFLQQRTDTLRIFLFAPREFKLRYLQAHTQNEAKANELVDSVDRNRRAFVKHYFGVEWPHRPAYHAMLNTALGEELTIATILKLMEALNKKETSS
jgi:cytidylate kinase